MNGCMLSLQASFKSCVVSFWTSPFPQRNIVFHTNVQVVRNDIISLYTNDTIVQMYLFTYMFTHTLYNPAHSRAPQGPFCERP